MTVRLPVPAEHTRPDGLRRCSYAHGVEFRLARPSTADIVGNGTDARSNLGAALWRRRRVPAFTSVTPALRNVSEITRYIEA